MSDDVIGKAPRALRRLHRERGQQDGRHASRQSPRHKWNLHRGASPFRKDPGERMIAA